MSIAKWIKNWLGINDDISKIREEVLQDIRKNFASRIREIVSDEDQHHKDDKTALESFKEEILKKMEAINSRFDDYLELESRVNELSNKVNRFKTLEDMINSIESAISDKSSKIDLKLNEVVTDYKSFQPQIVETSKQLSATLEEIKVIKTDFESGINGFRSELGDLVKNIVSGDINQNLTSYLKIPEGSKVATGNDVKSVQDNISQVNEKIDIDHKALTTVCEFLVKIYRENSTTFKDFFDEISDDLPIDNSNFDI